ncbi:hypothetical protein KFE25_003056 [Diacronema lutheri]|uniref:SRCR domain-containing protein n=1 Tax=Diacronema lutheri TaxID=2081491 RepID=A0A8J5X511_DIALT|nr:hypothetical protein KFE25_003056 [Diacronema lutheri]
MAASLRPLECALLAAALLASPLCATRVSWRETHQAGRRGAAASHSATPVPVPRTRTEVGVEVQDQAPVLWSLIPSPYSEEMQKLASKGDSHASLAPQKYDGWRAWKAKFRPNRAYASVAEEVQAFRAYIENDQVIQTHNADHASSYYSLGHSEWSAHSFHEFENLIFPVKLNDIMPPVHAPSGEHVYLGQDGRPKPIPESVDWTKEGAVSPVSNQGECGSCWAFASTGAVEGLCAIAGNTPNADGPVALSQQELVSCDVGSLAAPYADDGCDGGLPQNAFGYISSTGGVCAEAEYTYTSGNEAALMHAVAQQPVAVGIQANSMQLQLYRSGVFDSPSCGKEPDHAVLIVGYGTTSTNVPYWKVKNSWGATWGDGGYFYLKRGVNQCGITTMPSYPVDCQSVNGGDPRGKAEAPLPSPANCPAPRDGDIKLTSYPAGNLLLHFEGAWHPLCSQHLAIETAELMCKALGYTTAWSFSDRTIPTQDTGPMFPSLHCNKTASSLPPSQIGGSNVLDVCTFKGAHTSDWLCELFGPSMAAYLVCHGTTPPQEVQACGTAGWPNRRLAPATDGTAVAALRDALAARSDRASSRQLGAMGVGAAACVALLAAVGVAYVRRRQRTAGLLV